MPLNLFFVWYLNGIIEKVDGPLPRHIEPRPDQLTTVANQWLVRFPEAIAGASHVQKYAYANATQCLVHIRQIHEVPDMTSKEETSTKNTQDDIYAILSFLISRFGIHEVFAESITPQYERSINRQWQQEGKDLHLAYNLARTSLWLRRFGLMVISNRTTRTDNKRLRSWVDQERSRIQVDADKLRKLSAEIEESYRLRAIERLVREGRITLKATEDLQLNKKIVSWVHPRRKTGMSKWEILGAFNLLTRLRERDENVIEMVAQAGTPIIIMVFGGKHEFRRVLIDRNNDPHASPMSLIEITPQRYSPD